MQEARISQDTFASALSALRRARGAQRERRLAQLLDTAAALMMRPGGVATLYGFAPEFDAAGVFEDSDWAVPEKLQPSYVAATLREGPRDVAIEALSELRLLAIATGDAVSDSVDAEQARRFLNDVLALNLGLLFPNTSEAIRAERMPLQHETHQLFRFIVNRLGVAGILESLVSEAERVLLQRPILVHRVVDMIDCAADTLGGSSRGPLYRRTRRLIHAVRGPTRLSRECGDLEAYARALDELDPAALRREQRAFAQSMLATGLVSPQHAVLAQHANRSGELDALVRVLGLDDVGRDSLDAYDELLPSLLDRVAHPALAQSIYGLSCLLNRGILFFPPLAPGLWRLLDLDLAPEVAQSLRDHVDGDETVDPNAVLLAGTVSVLGQPLGVGQGDNPTCQSVRAISLWAQCESGFLLELITWAARDDEVDMHFEGALLRSSNLQPGELVELEREVDAVSLVLVPHLDRIYAEMARRTEGRGEDPHKWINPEFHGWWVHRGFAIAVRETTAGVVDFIGFMQLFHAAYHPQYNGGRLMVYPQPAGIAATDINGSFIGWHAVSIQRVTTGPAGDVRVYFYNPNNDGEQDWGQGIVTSAAGCEEEPGESSLPFHQFAARLYLFHYNPRELGEVDEVPEEEIDRIAELAHHSWAAELGWQELINTR